MTQVLIRPADLTDLPALLAIENAAFASDRLDRRAIRHAIRSPTILSLVAAYSARLLGYALVETRRGSRTGRLTSLAVAPASAGKGVGRALLEAAESAARAAGCEVIRLAVRTDNKRAERLYERSGYRLLGREADYYEDGDAAAHFGKTLAPERPGPPPVRLRRRLARDGNASLRPD